MGELNLAPVLLSACPGSGTGPGRAQRPRAVGASPCQHNTLLMLPWAACMYCCGCLEGRLWKSCSFPPLPSSCWLCKEGAWEPESQSTQSPFSSQGLGYTHLQVLAMGNCWRRIQTNYWRKKKKNPVRNCIARDQTWSGETADKAIRDAMCLRCSD